MKIIFSNVKYPEYVSKSWAQLAALSNYFFKKHGFETVFFGDEESLKEFKNIEYTHFEKIEKNEINQFPQCLWSMGKLVALNKISEPCLHVDMDIFLQQPFLNQNLLKSDIICLHDEIFASNNMIKLQQLFQYRKPKEAYGDTISYNCGLIGGNDFITLQKAINIVFNYVTDNYEFIEKINNKYKNNPDIQDYFYPPVLAEQIWLFQILKNFFNKEIQTIIPAPLDWKMARDSLLSHGIVHLMSQKKEDIVIHAVNKKVDYLDIKY